MAAAKPFDIVVFGATGFTGRLISEYLARVRAQGTVPLRLAIAGRDEGKLRAVSDALEKPASGGEAVPVLVADATDEKSLENLVKQTRVIVAAAGPFMRFGTPLLGACARNGVHYCDITGETAWIRQMIQQFDEEATRNGAKIINSVGFDSVPSDLGALMLADAVRTRYGVATREIKTFLGRNRLAVSGGTIASIVNAVETVTTQPAKMRGMGDPYCLVPGCKAPRPPGGEQRLIGYDRDIGRFTAPWLMEAGNTRIVHRSNALRDFAYGPAMRYREVTSKPRTVRGFLSAVVATIMLPLLIIGFYFRPLRRLLLSRLPAPGQGPSREAMARGYLQMDLVAIPDGGKPNVTGRIVFSRDAGYMETATMAAESALCLAFDGDKLPKRAGFLTPAVAMGDVLLQRLRAANIRFEVDP